MRARCGSRSIGTRDAPAISQTVMIRTITARTAVFAAASVAAVLASRALAKTAAIATQPFGLATPSTVPPASEGASALALRTDNGGAVAMWYVSHRMWAADDAIRSERIPGMVRSAAV